MSVFYDFPSKRELIHYLGFVNDATNLKVRQWRNSQNALEIIIKGRTHESIAEILSKLDTSLRFDFHFGMQIFFDGEVDGASEEIKFGRWFKKSFVLSLAEEYEELSNEASENITNKSGGIIFGVNRIVVHIVRRSCRLGSGMKSFGNFTITPTSKKNCGQWTIAFLRSCLTNKGWTDNLSEWLSYDKNRHRIYPSQKDLCLSGFWPTGMESSQQAFKRELQDMSELFKIKFVLFTPSNNKTFQADLTIGRTEYGQEIGLIWTPVHVELISKLNSFRKNYVNGKHQIAICKTCPTRIFRSKRSHCKACIQEFQHVKPSYNVHLRTKDPKAVKSQWRKPLEEPHYRFLGALDIETKKNARGFEVPICISAVVFDTTNWTFVECVSLDLDNCLDDLHERIYQWKEDLLKRSYGEPKNKHGDPCVLCRHSPGIVMHHNHLTMENIGYACLPCNIAHQQLRARKVKIYTWNGKRFDMSLLMRNILADHEFRQTKKRIPHAIITEGKGFKQFQYRDFIFVDLKAMMAPTNQSLSEVFESLPSQPLIEPFKMGIGRAFKNPQDAFKKWDMKPFFEADKTHWPIGNYPCIEEKWQDLQQSFLDLPNKNEIVISYYCVVDCWLTLSIAMSRKELYWNSFKVAFENFLTAPSMSFAMLKSQIPEELQLESEEDVYWNFQRAVRGGIVQVNNRHHIKKEGRRIGYFDANNLYGTAMLELLPVGGIIKEGDPTVTFEFVRVEWPEELKEKRRWQALPPTMKKEKYDLSQFDKDRETEFLENGKPRPIHLTPKLCCVMETVEMLCDKRLSDYYREIGLKVEVISSTTVKGAYLCRDFIKTNHEKRQEIRKTNPVLGDTYKLFNNSVYGKFVEDTRKYKKIKIADNLNSAIDEISKKEDIPPFIIQDFDWTSTVAVEYFEKPKITKQPWVGVSLLDISKLHMFRQLDKLFDEDSTTQLLYMDTDSFIVDMKQETVFPNQGDELGQFKDEFPNHNINEFLCGGPKFYGLFDEDKIRIVAKAKGNQVPDGEIYSYYYDAVYGIRAVVNSHSKKVSDFQPKLIRGSKIFGSRYDVKRVWFDVHTSYPHGCM